MPELSVIIIGRNEAARIESCLRSVLASLADHDDYEIIYVDSASEDQTVEIARRFPIRILQLRRTWKLTPSAGRFVGYRHSTGKYLLFVDGDTALFKRWITEAITYLANNPTIGGVAGIVHRAYVSREGKCIAIRKNYFRQSVDKKVQYTSALGGIALYRREAMEKAGTFNPHLTTGEECEVALRIQRAGYKLVRIYSPMCITYSWPFDSMREIMRRASSHLYDYGTTLRYCVANGCGIRFSIAQMSFIYTFVASTIGFVAMITLACVTGATWLLFTVAAVALLYVALKRRHPSGIVLSLLIRAMMTYCTIRSFMSTKIMSADSYPTDVVVVK